MNIQFTTIAMALFMALFTVTTAEAARPKAVDSKESYKMVKTNPGNTFIVDVRTQAEYIFVGHPDIENGVPNIPLKFFPSWKSNPDFVADVAKRYKKTDTLIMMCRSGGRASMGANLLVKAGFKKVLFMTDSFEGQTNENGYRTVDGWKVNNLPYTFGLEPDLLYK